MRNTEEAFQWIVKIFQKYNIFFQVTGGLAARAYGAKRELADIDFDVAEAEFVKFLPEVQEYIIFGPANYKDENWDLFLLTICYVGQEIDISGSQAKIFDQNQKQWTALPTNFSAAEMKEIFGIKVPVIPKIELIEYKSKLRREVDLVDLKELGIPLTEFFVRDTI